MLQAILQNAGVPTLAVQHWRVSEQPGADGLYVEITGRAPGFMGKIMTAIGVSPVSTLKVNKKEVIMESSNFAGKIVRTIPMKKISSTEFIFAKPVHFLFLAIIFIWTIILPIVFGYLYFKKKSYMIGVNSSGGGALIKLQGGMFEGTSIDEKECKRVTDIIRDLMTGRARE